MKKSKQAIKKSLMFPILILGLTFLIACGGQQGGATPTSGSTGTSSPSPSTQSPSPSPTTAASSPAPQLKLINDGYLTVGTDASYPPMESVDPKTGQIVGADVDLANALAKAMGLKGAKIVNNSFDTIIAALQRGKFDIIMSSMNDTLERRQQVDFVDYMTASIGIVAPSDSNIKADSYKDLCGYTVSVQRGTVELDELQKVNEQCPKKMTLKTFTQDTDAWQALVSGHVDVYTSDLPVTAFHIKENPSKFKLAGKPFSAGQNYGIAIPKNRQDLKNALTKALQQIRASGEYDRILKKWGVEGAALKE